MRVSIPVGHRERVSSEIPRASERRATIRSSDAPCPPLRYGPAALLGDQRTHDALESLLAGDGPNVLEHALEVPLGTPHALDARVCRDALAIARATAARPDIVDEHPPGPLCAKALERPRAWRRSVKRPRAGHSRETSASRAMCKRHREDQPDLVERQDTCRRTEQRREAVPHPLLAGHRGELGADQDPGDDADGQQQRQLARPRDPGLQCVMLPGTASMAIVVRLVPMAFLIG